MKNNTFSTLLLLSIASNSMAQSEWVPLAFQFDSHIAALFTFDGDLVVGGNFTEIDGSECLFSAVYNGSTYTANSTQGLAGTGFSSFTEHKGKLIGGGGSTVGIGSFSPSMVLEWNGSEWGNSSYRLDGRVYQVISYHDTLFTATTFTKSSVGFDYSAYNAGVGWIQAGGGFDSSPSYIVFDGALYAYGPFTTCGSNTVKYFAKWQNGNWVQAGTGLRSVIHPVEFKNKLFAFEQISKDGLEKTLQLVEWNGADWVAHSSQTVVTGANILRAITSDNNNIYIAGDLLKAGNKTVFNSARFDGNNWFAMGNALDTVLVNTLEVYNGDLYAGTLMDFYTKKAYIYKFSLSQIANVADAPKVNMSFLYDNSNRQIEFFDNENGAYNIITSLGSSVLKGIVSSNSKVNLNNLPPGVYVVKLDSRKGIESKKLLIK